MSITEMFMCNLHVVHYFPPLLDFLFMKYTPLEFISYTGISDVSHFVTTFNNLYKILILFMDSFK